MEEVFKDGKRNIRAEGRRKDREGKRVGIV